MTGRLRTGAAAALRHRVFGLPVHVVDVIVVVAGIGALGLIAIFGGMTDSEHLHVSHLAFSRRDVLLLGLLCATASALPTTVLGWDLDHLSAKNAELDNTNAELIEQEEGTRRTGDNLMHLVLEQMLRDNNLLSDERLTVFIDDPDGEGMVVGARYAVQPRYMDDNVADVLPFGVGCVGRARETGMSQHVVLPDPSVGDNWQRALEENWDVPRDLSASMCMQPRTVYARRIDGIMGSAGKALGVLALESTQAPPVSSGVPKRAKLELQDLEQYFNRKSQLVHSLFVHAAELHAAKRAAESRRALK